MKINIVVLLFIPVLFMVGCNQSVMNTPIPSSTELHFSYPGATAPLPTTPLVVQPSPTMPPSATSTFQAAPTLTLSPTLDLEQRTSYLLDWLHNTERCPLPCWFGIVPGESTWSDLETLFRHLGAIVVNETTNTYVFHGIGGFNSFGLYTVFELYEQDDRITAMDVHSDSWNDATQSDFRAMWESYAPEVIIEDYGCPSQVRVLSESRPSHEIPYGDHIWYTIWFYYENLGGVISYEGRTDYEPVYRMCPSFTDEGNLGQHLRIEMRSSDGSNIIQWGSLSNLYGMPIEEASSLSLDEFCNLYIQESEPVCFDTQRDIWP